MKKSYDFFNINRGSCIYISKILFDTTLIMLERTMSVATILFLGQYKFNKPWYDDKHNAKVWTVN